MRSLFLMIPLTLAIGAQFAANAATGQGTSSTKATPTLGATATSPLPTVQVPPPAANIKYKSGKDLDFEQLLIQGELKRPELSIVTGNVQPGSDGLLRLRENFNDRIATDVGEELP